MSKHTSQAEIGNVVSLYHNHGNRVVMLVDPEESDPFSNRISIQSPLGQAVLHKHKYDFVDVDTPRGKETYIVKGIY